MGFGESASMQAGPDLVFQQPAGHQNFIPETGGRVTVFGQELGEHNRGIDVDHRSLRSSSSSPSKSWSGATDFGLGSFPATDSTGGVNHPLRTASANWASASIGLRVTWGGPISAITRPRSVTRTVSPDAASRTYSLSRLLSTFMPTAFMESKVATGSYFVKLTGQSLELSDYATLIRPTPPTLISLVFLFLSFLRKHESKVSIFANQKAKTLDPRLKTSRMTAKKERF